MTKSELKSKIAAFVAARDEALKAVDDDTAVQNCVAVFPKMLYNGDLIKAQTRINYEGKLYKAAQDLWDRMENNPGHAPNLWTEVVYTGGVREIPEVITAADAFQEGEKGRWKGEIYISLISGNVWTPDVLPTAWQKI